uniref:Calcitonin peptide-like domain-containing protein n=1 Tax=Sinocyclocheilus grahami TaxID=75366 RepID=A0A672R170_SINGR
MNSMFLVWTLSSLILSYTLGFSTLNSTSSGSQMKTFLNVTEGNFTDYSKTNQTRHEQLEKNPIHGMSRGTGCFLGTCATQNLGHRLQTGDEKAGKSASDSWGPGKK